LPIRRQFPPRAFEARDLASGAVEPLYIKVLTRLLAAHALAEKLTAEGYARALEAVSDAALRETVAKNLAEERKHATLIYDALAELGVDEVHADRAMLTVRRSPSFDAARRFAEHGGGEVDLLMASLSLDMTGLLMIGINYKDSSYAPHARAADIILEEEADHDVFGFEGLREAVERHGRETIYRALCEWLPCAANFFGPPGSGFTYDCIRMGLKAKDNQEIAQLYLTMLGRRLEQMGLTLPRLTDSYPHTLAA
jgi:1,2-phenylacetyl-CoA epoxidase catalytic subunit